MSDSATRDRLLELLADRAVQGISGDERGELDVLLADHPEVDEAGLDWAAAALDLAFAGPPSEPLPLAVRSRVESDATEWASRRAPGAARTPPPAGRPWRVAPWLLAAASVALALIAWLPARSVDLTAQRDELIAADGTTLVTWQDEHGAVTGDVAWNPVTQTGFMRFRGLASNDPGDYQYQLWIFDGKRSAYSENIAVDGGVFDVDRATGDVFVPIDAKLKVFEPTLFAVTTEPPGGVVKHNPDLDPTRYRIILTAPVGPQA